MTGLKGFRALKAPRVAAMVVAGLLAAAPAVASAQTPPRTPVAPQPVSPVAQAAKQVQDAQAQLNLAKANYAKARARVEASFKGRPDWAKAQQDADKAKAAAAAAAAVVQAGLEKRADYKAAKESVAILTDKQAKALQDATGASGDAGQIGQQLVDQRAAVKKMETDAFEADPNYADAKRRLEAAQQAQSALQAQVDQAAATDPDCAAAQQQIEAAQQQVASAQQNLAQVRKSEADARAAAAKAKAASSGSPGGTIRTPPRY